MNAKETADKALEYREGNATFARLDLQAAIDGVPGAVNRFGNDVETLTEACEILFPSPWNH